MTKIKYEYPIDDRDEYKGRIRFRTIQEENISDSAAKAIDKLAEGKRTQDSLVKQKKESGGAVQSATDVPTSDADKLSQIAKEDAAHNGDGNKTNVASTITTNPAQILLYMPAGIQFRDAVSYDNVDLGMGGAAVAGGASMTAGMTGGIKSFVDSLSNASMDSKVGALVGKQALAKGALSLLGGAGAGVAGGITAAAGVVINPNTQALFKSVNLREFSFTFKMVPRSKKESQEIKEIIKMFRSELYPEDILTTVAGVSVSVGYAFPNRWQIDLEYNNKHIGHKIKPCFLRDVATTYNATQMGFHHDAETDEAEFMEVDLTLTFQESETMKKSDVIEGGY